MSQSVLHKFVGPTTRLDVINSAHGAVTVSAATSEPSNYAAFLNVGASPVHVVVVSASVNNPPTPVFPTDTNGPQIGFTVPPLMVNPMLVATPSPFQMSAISNSATASSLFVVPAGNL